jgi:hypothetical protein
VINLAVCLALFTQAEPTTPVQLDVVPRSGYALVTAKAQGKEIKQVEFFATAAGASVDITYDQAGNTLVVTLPSTGTVTVHAVALLADNTLVPPVSVELPTAKPAPAPTPDPAPTPVAGRLRVTLVVNLPTASQPEKDLLNSEDLAKGLTEFNADFLFADATDPKFQQVLAGLQKDNPKILGPDATPFLLVQSADGKALGCYRLTLRPTVGDNVKAILQLFGDAHAHH